MPLYEYVCSSCNLKFELLRPVSRATEDAPCLHCKNNAKRVLSSFGIFSKDERGFTRAYLSNPGSGACATCGSKNCSSCGA